MSDLKNDFETAIFIMERLVQHAGQCEARDKAYEFLEEHPLPGSYQEQANQQREEYKNARSPEGYEYDEKGCLVRPAEIMHLIFTPFPDLWGMEKKGGSVGELATKELKFRDAVYSQLGQG